MHICSTLPNAVLWLSFFVSMTVAVPDAPADRIHPSKKLLVRTHPLAVTNQYATVQRVATRPGSSKMRYATGRRGYSSKILRDIDAEGEWAININFGGEKALVLIDTGSSDTWLVHQGFQCVSETLKHLREEACAFGPAFNGSFPAGSNIRNENFNITYGDGEFISGSWGYDDLTVAGIKVKSQQLALVDLAFWDGDGITSGILGLAYSGMTSAFVGTDPTIDNFNQTGSAPGDKIPYAPVVQSMIGQGLINAPLFSLALQRSQKDVLNSAGGYVAFGGLPPVAFDPVFARTPILVWSYPAILTGLPNNFTEYTIVPDGYVYANKHGGRGVKLHKSTKHVIVDSGTTILAVPSAVAAGYVATFDPPAVSQDGSGVYFCPCNSTAPYFGVKIAGTVFNVSSPDIILPNSGYVNDTSGVEYCLIGVLDEALAGGFPILGDVFLKNVVAVFDIGASLMRFAVNNY